MIGIVDADIIVYRCGFAAEKRRKEVQPNGDVEHFKDLEPLGNALHNVDTVIDSLMARFPEGLEFYLSGSDNFRVELATVLPYKGNRSPFARPEHYKEIRRHLKSKYNAAVINGMEADDELGIRSTSLGDDGCIITIDKDLDMIPGHHFNWVKDKGYYIDEQQGNRNFYKQVLVGDRVDNIPGIHGVGPKRAEHLIDQLSNERAMWYAVRKEWHDHYPKGYEGKSADAVCFEVAQLLWIARRGRERFSPPT